MSKIGILGGTFNPIHNGHLLLAEQARCFYGLDQVLFIPSGCSYMKRQEEILPGEIRFQMVQLAIADNPYFCVSDMEIVREGNSYTCETITRLHAQYPEDEHQIDIASDDEVGDLAAAFNKMSKQIRRYIARLNEKANLENELRNSELKNLNTQNMLRDAELKALQSQINPHFLFNTLNCIAQTAMFEDAAETNGAEEETPSETDSEDSAESETKED